MTNYSPIFDINFLIHININVHSTLETIIRTVGVQSFVFFFFPLIIIIIIIIIITDLIRLFIVS